MEPRNQELLIERLAGKLRAGAFRTLHVCWFGAEPIAGKGVIRALTPRLIAVAAEHGCEYEARIVTNGLALSDQMAVELVQEHRVRFIEVTLDGSAVYHDARRHTKAGHPTFARIFNNVVSLARRNDLDVTVRIRCNVDRRNFEGVVPLLHMLKDAGIQDRVSFYVAPIHSWGNDAHKESLELLDFAERELDWYVEASRLGFSVPLLPGVNPVVCMAVKPSAELVDAYGSVFNCTEVSYVPLYGTPNRFALGTLAEDTRPDNWHILGDFNSKVANHEYPCSSCRMLPVCGGSCPKQWLEGHIPCPSTKVNIEGRLLLTYAMQRLDTGDRDVTHHVA